jgi:hypothetical protein
MPCPRRLCRLQQHASSGAVSAPEDDADARSIYYHKVTEHVGVRRAVKKSVGTSTLSSSCSGALSGALLPTVYCAPLMRHTWRAWLDVRPSSLALTELPTPGKIPWPTLKRTARARMGLRDHIPPSTAPKPSGAGSQGRLRSHAKRVAIFCMLVCAENDFRSEQEEPCWALSAHPVGSCTLLHGLAAWLAGRQTCARSSCLACLSPAALR